MRRTKGLLLIVAGGSVLSPLGFGMGFYAWFLLNHVAVSVDAEPRALLLLAADLGLAAWLYVAGIAACRGVCAR